MNTRFIIGKILIILLLQGFFIYPIYSQIRINEASNRNVSQIADEDGEYCDWIELYNAGIDSIRLKGLFISDDSTNLKRWAMPSIGLSPGKFLLLFASGKNRKPLPDPNHWETIIGDTSTWDWIIPNESISPYWLMPGFNTEGWNPGKPGFGYGDNDDSTKIDTTALSVYLLKTFEVQDTGRIGDMILDMDYDDGFVAYLNGFIIAQSGFPQGRPAYNQLSVISHEAQIYQGLPPEAFYIPAYFYKKILNPGTNVLAIEVHNSSSTSSDLSAIPFLTFGIKDTTHIWNIPPAWLSDPSYSFNLHANFKLARTGEGIYLSDSAGILLDRMELGKLNLDNSFGLKEDGASETGIFTQASPGSSNNSTAAFNGYCPEPQFIDSAGFYENAITVHIADPPQGCIIRYTTNGKFPDSGDPVYNGPISVSATTVIKARYFDLSGALLPGRSACSTYFIHENITLPVISISMDNTSLYGGSGIYDNWWTDWKKPCYIEYFNKNGNNKFSQYSGIKIDGGAGGSRSLAQKSFRLEPDNSSYGDGVIKYRLIPRKPDLKRYETFYLRNGSNMSNVYPYKDAFMVRSTEGTHNEFMAYTPVVVFLNGEYWGLYELREKLDEGHFKYARGINPDSLDLLSMGFWYQSVLRTLQGSAEDWQSMRNLLSSYPLPESNEFYKVMDSVLDLENFTDYMIAETWLGNADWPWNNIKIWRNKGGDNKWNYGLIDVEWGLGYNGWSNASTDMIGYVLDPSHYYTGFFTNMIRNEDYRNYFLNRYADLMNSTFLSSRTMPMEDSMYMEMKDEMPRQLARWGDVSQTMPSFETYRGALRNDMQLRSDQVRNHIVQHFGLPGKVKVNLNTSPPGSGTIEISTIKTEHLPWTGIYFKGVPIKFKAIPTEGFTFDHWEPDPNIANKRDSIFTTSLSGSEIGFTAIFRGAPAGKEMTISEINYHSESSIDGGNWIEILNTGIVPKDISGWVIKDSNPNHHYTIPGGMVLEPEERWVFTTDTAKFRKTYPDVQNFGGPVGFSFSNHSDIVSLYDSLMNLKAMVAYNDSLPWPAGADGLGRTLELKDPSKNINDPSNWFEGCIGGSPGKKYSPCNEPVIFSEINYNSNMDFNTGDWVELRNLSNNPLDIGGWIFMDDSVGPDHTYQLPYPLSLPPHSNWVLTGSNEKFSLLNPGVTNFSGPFLFKLNGGGEWIRLYDMNGKLRQTMKYDDDPPWPADADGKGYTLEIVDSLGTMDDGTNWTSICEGGSPGNYPSGECRNLVGPPGDVTLVLQPNPAFENTAMRVEAVRDGGISIKIYNSQGSFIKILYEGEIHKGSQLLTLQTSGLTKGMYFIIINYGSEERLVKMIKL